MNGEVLQHITVRLHEEVQANSHVKPINVNVPDLHKCAIYHNSNVNIGLLPDPEPPPHSLPTFSKPSITPPCAANVIVKFFV
ncbi:hypothetical protein J6590_011325 [Homalodisca vitripennis]|nr:hypothetical protein J6590_011325 [Homalodisca vitripennis]